MFFHIQVAATPSNNPMSPHAPPALVQIQWIWFHPLPTILSSKGEVSIQNFHGLPGYPYPSLKTLSLQAEIPLSNNYRKSKSLFASAKYLNSRKKLESEVTLRRFGGGIKGVLDALPCYSSPCATEAIR